MSDGGVTRHDQQISTPAASTPTKVPDSSGPAAGNPGGESGVPAVTHYVSVGKYYELGEVAMCHDCGLPYPFALDAVLPDDLWARVSPTGDEGGLLCANCIVARLAELEPSPVIVKLTPVWAEDYE